jgi:8-oxo-dGTP pyrophosphatase MutT (NUDIX family)
VKGVVAQRLLRKLCLDCSSPDVAPDAQRVAACRSCGGAGFRGRLPIAEILIGSADFEARVSAGETVERIAEASRVGGMRSLWQSGMAHVAAGRTTIDEVRRVATEDRSTTATPRSMQPPVRMVAEGPSRGSLALVSTPLPSAPRTGVGSIRPMAELRIGTVDVYVIRPLPDGWKVLVLQRADDTRCPGTWETVHGSIDAGEEPEQAALREVAEETSLTVERLYSVTVQTFYLPKSHVVQVGVGFAAFVAEPGAAVMGREHTTCEWLSVEDAMQRFHWPRERDGLRDAVKLLAGGSAGPAEDVLRVY